MVRIARFDVLLVAGLAVVLLAGCAGSGSDKAGGKSARKVVVLTLANPLGGSLELDAFVGEVNRLSGGAIRIDVKSGWRSGQVAFENGLIGDVRAGKADLGVASSRAWDSVGVQSFRALGGHDHRGCRAVRHLRRFACGHGALGVECGLEREQRFE